MATNPLFQGSLPAPTDTSSAGLDPFAETKAPDQPNAAVELIRQKLNRLYKNEPEAKEELAEAKVAPQPRSKHQAFMYQLSTSGKGLAEIQTEWHNYYQALPDDEKHAVWQEFYSANAQAHQHKASPVAVHEPAVSLPAPQHVPEAVVSHHEPASTDKRSPKAIRQHLRQTVGTRGKKLQAKHHFQAILFGLGFGSVALLITLFGFFNEVVIAPFIQPGRSASATPIILGTNDVAPTKDPEVIIPKINVEIPLDFSVTTTNESQIETALEGGVVHYPTTAKPGEKGNAAFFGHSSNNIFNPGKYKFAFVLLHELVAGDTFYLTYGGKVYAYQVFDKQIVEPSNVSVLNPVAGQTATATLITCDPPGTSLHRLVVWGKQVSPDPSTNTDTTAVTTTTSTNNSTKQKPLPGNGPTLWGRLVKWITGH